MEYQIIKPLRESSAVYNNVRLGAPSTRHTHESIIRKLIKELYSMKMPINSIQELESSHVNALINYWGNKKLSKSTIGNRLSVLRKYLKLTKVEINFSSNHDLGLSRKTVSYSNNLEKTFSLSENIIDRTQHHLTRLLLSMQIYFGLTKLEAIHLSPQVYQERKKILFIPKAIAHNNKDRFIAIKNAVQETIISNLLNEIGAKLSLADKFDKDVLLGLFNAEISLLQLSPKTPFRAIYARNTYQSLLNQEKLPQKKAIEVIAEEMGMSKRKNISCWVSHEQISLR